PIWLDKAIEKALNIHEGARYSALSEWLTDLKRPNPSWLMAQEIPLIDRHPLLTWKIIAATGWIAVAFLLIDKA
ncbi:MAG: hypothetical protein ACI9Y1_003628, partial [Lentisphaeria bacterium]